MHIFDLHISVIHNKEIIFHVRQECFIGGGNATLIYIIIKTCVNSVFALCFLFINTNVLILFIFLLKKKYSLFLNRYTQHLLTRLGSYVDI